MMVVTMTGYGRDGNQELGCHHHPATTHLNPRNLGIGGKNRGREAGRGGEPADANSGHIDLGGYVRVSSSSRGSTSVMFMNI